MGRLHSFIVGIGVAPTRARSCATSCPPVWAAPLNSLDRGGGLENRCSTDKPTAWHRKAPQGLGHQLREGAAARALPSGVRQDQAPSGHREGKGADGHTDGPAEEELGRRQIDAARSAHMDLLRPRWCGPELHGLERASKSLPALGLHLGVLDDGDELCVALEQVLYIRILAADDLLLHPLWWAAPVQIAHGSDAPPQIEIWGMVWSGVGEGAAVRGPSQKGGLSYSLNLSPGTVC